MSFFGIILIAMAVGCLLVVGPGLIAAVVAHRKGYRPWFWILSCGLVGLVVTAVMPPIRQAETPELRERWETRADWTGGILSTLTFMSVMVFPLVGSLFLFGGVASVKSGFTAPLNRPIQPPITVEAQVLDVENMESDPLQTEGKVD